MLKEVKGWIAFVMFLLYLVSLFASVVLVFVGGIAAPISVLIVILSNWIMNKMEEE